jgi:secreted trypsin-like serine protease
MISLTTSILLVLLAQFASSLSKIEGDNGDRLLIVNGEDADPEDYQFYARAGDDDLKSTLDRLCGASLIHRDMLLTAAHCQGAFNYGVRMYDSDTNDYTREVPIDEQRRFNAFNFNNINLNYDILVSY